MTSRWSATKPLCFQLRLILVSLLDNIAALVCASHPLPLLDFSVGTCCSWFRFMWFMRNYRILPRSVKGECWKCTSRCWLSKFSHWLRYGGYHLQRRKFFLVEKEFAALNAFQSEMSTSQDMNWVIIQEQVAIYEQNFYILRLSDQLLVANQQPNFIFNAVSSLFSMIHASVKNYRSVLLAFRIIIFNSIQVLLKVRLTMSLIPMELLLASMDTVGSRQSKVQNCLTLATPTSDSISCYDFSLFVDALTVSTRTLVDSRNTTCFTANCFYTFRSKIYDIVFSGQPSDGSWKEL